MEGTGLDERYPSWFVKYYPVEFITLLVKSDVTKTGGVIQSRYGDIADAVIRSMWYIVADK